MVGVSRADCEAREKDAGQIDDDLVRTSGAKKRHAQHTYIPILLLYGSEGHVQEQGEREREND